MIDWSKFHTVGTPRSGQQSPKKPYITFGFTLVIGKVVLTYFIIGGRVFDVLACGRTGVPYDLMTDPDDKVVAVRSPANWGDKFIKGKRFNSYVKGKNRGWKLVCLSAADVIEEMAPLIKTPTHAKSITIEGVYNAVDGACVFSCKAPYDPKAGHARLSVHGSCTTSPSCRQNGRTKNPSLRQVMMDEV